MIYQNVYIFFFSLQQPLSSANFLYELDKITQDVLLVSVFVSSGSSGHVIFIPEQLYVKLKLTNSEKKSPFVTSDDVTFNNMKEMDT